MTIVQAAAFLALWSGAFFFLAGTVGVLRFPDVYTRLHAVTKADNVVIMRVRNVPDGNRDVLGSASVLSETVGRGKVTLYRNGVRIDGTWSRSKSSAPLRFADSSGKDIALKPGQTWVTLQG